MSPSTKQSLDRIFEFAVLASWGNLMTDRQSGLIHVEYGYASNGHIDSLQIWASTKRGYWRLACEYCSQASPQHERGLHFETGVRSDVLQNVLELVLQHQNRFDILPNLGRRCLLQITQPTEQQTAAACASLDEVLEQLASLQPLLADVVADKSRAEPAAIRGHLYVATR